MAPGAPRIYIVNAGLWARSWWLLRTACVTAYEDGCLGIAKSAAYSALLAFFPLLTTLATLLVRANAGEVSRVISGLLFEVVPPGTEELVAATFTVRGARPAVLLVVAGALAAWAASGVTMSLMEGFQAVYRIPSGRPMLKQRGVAILLVLGSVLPVLGASSLILFGARTERLASRWLGLLPEGAELQGWLALAGQFVRILVALGSIVLVTMLLYYFGPRRRQRWRYLWPGALVATALWLAATTAFAWYVRNIANYNLLYGSIGAVIALLVWMYVVAVIALVGCEFNAVRERWLEARDAVVPVVRG